LIEGTVVHAVTRQAPGNERTIIIGHPAGSIEAGAQVGRREGTWVAEKVVTRRTARRLMEGVAFVPASLWGDEAAGTRARTPAAARTRR
jgi:2-methylaconitate cis-trans-isomerase PrpF